jgi:hypothetical protein
MLGGPNRGCHPMECDDPEQRSSQGVASAQDVCVLSILSAQLCGGSVVHCPLESWIRTSSFSLGARSVSMASTVCCRPPGDRFSSLGVISNLYPFLSARGYWVTVMNFSSWEILVILNGFPLLPITSMLPDLAGCWTDSFPMNSVFGLMLIFPSTVPVIRIMTSGFWGRSVCSHKEPR